METLKTDLISWQIGPYHQALPGPMKVVMTLDGEVIVRAAVETGFTHKGLEKAFEMHSWRAVIPYLDRLDPEAAIFGELVFCLAVEEIAGIKVSPRSQAIRLLVSELNRICSHLYFLARMANAVGNQTVVHYVTRDREKILDQFELLCGGRFSANFLRFGGVSADVSDGFLERVIEICNLVCVRVIEYHRIFSNNYGFLRRTQGLGILSDERVRQHSITGPNARASGVPFDVRLVYPYSGFENLELITSLSTAPSAEVGDSYQRYWLRLQEIERSAALIRQLAENLPQSEISQFVLEEDHSIPAGEAYVRVEGPRGLLGCHLVSDGGTHPCRVQFRVPSLGAISALPELLIGARIEDFPVILASLDLSIAEVDR